MNIPKLIEYAHKYMGTRTQGEDFRRQQNAEWIAKVLEENEELAHLLNTKYTEIGRFVRIVIPE